MGTISRMVPLREDLYLVNTGGSFQLFEEWLPYVRGRGVKTREFFLKQVESVIAFLPKAEGTATLALQYLVNLVDREYRHLGGKDFHRGDDLMNRLHSAGSAN